MTDVLHALRDAETEIKTRWNALSEDLKKDLANVWYERNQSEILRLHALITTLKTSPDVRQFIDYMNTILPDNFLDLLFLF